LTMSFFRKSKKKGSKAAAAPEFDGRGAPLDEGEEMYDEIDDRTEGAAAAHDASMRRRGNFTEMPEDGWKHDDRGMAAGMGVYFTFTVKYVGAMVMPTSISTVDHDDQTDITREVIAQVCDECIPNRVKVKRDLSEAGKSYPYSHIKMANKNIRLSISATGIVLAPVSRDDAIINFYPMKNISLATGGEDLDYDFISFTARDEQTKQREGHVFDCDIQSDAVMEALGQAFSLARELKAQEGLKTSALGTGYLDVVPDAARAAMAPPPGAEALYADLDSIMKAGLDNPTYGMKAPDAGGPSYMDVKPIPPAGGGALYMDVKPTPDGGRAGQAGAAGYMDVKPDPVAFALASNLAQGEALYDQAGGAAIGRQVAEVLNATDAYMDITFGGGADAEVKDDSQYLELPAWRAYDDVALTNFVDVMTLEDNATYNL